VFGFDKHIHGNVCTEFVTFLPTYITLLELHSIGTREKKIQYARSGSIFVLLFFHHFCGQFDLNKAKDVFAEELLRFLTRCRDSRLRVVLVDAPGQLAISNLALAYK
jgi:hypothetical protein